MTSIAMSKRLLAEIHANLDDDGPRLVYADELQLSGDPRGELIAVQCELARLGHATRPPSWDWIGDALVDVEAVDPSHIRKLRTRETALLKTHFVAWAGSATKIAQNVRFERGFIAHAAIPAALAAAPAKLDKLFDAAPTLEALELVTLMRANPSTLFECSSIAKQVRELDMPAFGGRALAKVATCALRVLSLRGDDIDGVRQLIAEWKNFGSLTRLGINGAGLDASDLSRLLDVAPALDELQLRQSNIGPAGASTLGSSAKTSKCRVLSLLANAIGPAGSEALADSAHLTGLRALDLRKNKIGAKGARAIGRAFPELRTLDLTGNPLGEEGVTALASGSGLGNLRELCLQQTGIDDAGARALARSKLLEHVRVLSLRSNKITDAGARVLAESPALRNLSQLNLNKNKIGADGKKALETSKHLRDARIFS